jgi:hypothetical protein
VKLRHTSLIVPTVLTLLLAAPACERSSTERWVTTKNTNVALDWDAVGKAYKEAEGPEDLERRVNELYQGDELISVAVVDKDDATQVVTGFFDKNEDGALGEGEAIFEITRKVTGQGSGTYQMQGHGYYAGYHSPVMGLATGMILGSMLSRSMAPGYQPMYRSAYVTNTSRRAALSNHRSTYRQANPSRFAKRSRSGKTYGSKGSGFGGTRQRTSAPRTRRFGGGRFGLAPATLAGQGEVARLRLTA